MEERALKKIEIQTSEMRKTILNFDFCIIFKNRNSKFDMHIFKTLLHAQDSKKNEI